MFGDERHLGFDLVAVQRGSPEGRKAVSKTKLGRDEPRLHLSGAEAAKLAPLVEIWLMRGAATNRVTSALTSGLPARVHQVAALVRHRLMAKVSAEVQPASVRPARQECSGCRAPIGTPIGVCRECASAAAHQAPGPIAVLGRTGTELIRAQLRRPGLAVA